MSEGGVVAAGHLDGRVLDVPEFKPGD